ncbi:MAG: hypothetical protein HZB67_02170 [Candidatus Aenigmarchaeota archaeon]|nr:hypothetical protein [Candidatus Aenigmarchaeota archaeon]
MKKRIKKVTNDSEIGDDVEQIFRSYDIRGLYGKDLNEHIMLDIGKSFGTAVRSDVVVAMDVRKTSPALKNSFINGVLSTGKGVEDIGILPLGAAMFYAWHNEKPFAYITASHLIKEWNGVKFFHGTGIGFSEKENMGVRDIFMHKNFHKSKPGTKKNIDNANIIEDYKKYLVSKIKPKKKLKIILDCCNGCAGMVAPSLFEAAGFHVIALFKEIDGDFPNHKPDVVESELNVLKNAVQSADFGFAYDGDGDRIVLVDDKGRCASPEQTSYILMPDILKTKAGNVIANMECSLIVDDAVAKHGRKVVRIPVGHTFLMENVKKTRAAYGVEKSGHVVLPWLFPFDDALAFSYFAACVLSGRKEKPSALINSIPKTHFERMTFSCSDNVKFRIIDDAKKELSKKYDRINTLDGIRIDFDDGWALLRSSNTAPQVRLSVEAASEEAFKKIKTTFREYLRIHMKKYHIELKEES